MKDENWPVEWLRQLNDDIKFFTKMIYAARTEIKSLVIKKAREDLQDLLTQNEWNQIISSKKTIDWLKQVQEKLEYTGLLLDLTATITGKNESSTQIAAKRARRLAKRISSTIGLIKKS